MTPSPYAPPPQNSPGYAGGYGQLDRYIPLGWKTTISVIGIAGMIILPPIQSVFSLATWEALKNPVEENFAVILLNGAIGLAQLAISVGTYVFFLMWMHHAAKNLRGLGQQLLTVTPGWAVGWWFIPIASIWMPFVAMREIYKASDPETVGPSPKYSWMTAPTPPILGMWWGTYILNGFVSMGVALATMDFSGKSGGAHAPGVGTFISHGLMAIAGVLVIIIIRQIAQRQEMAWQRLSSITGHEPPPVYAPANPYVPADTANPYAPPRS